MFAELTLMKWLSGLLAIVVMVGGFIGTGFYWGVTHASEAAVKEANKQIAAAIKDGIDRAAVNLPVKTVLQEKLRVIRLKGDTIIQEVETHVKDNGCRFDPSFGVLHNRAATNSIPDPGSGAGEPSPFSIANPTSKAAGLRPTGS